MDCNLKNWAILKVYVFSFGLVKRTEILGSVRHDQFLLAFKFARRLEFSFLLCFFDVLPSHLANILQSSSSVDDGLFTRIHLISFTGYFNPSLPESIMETTV